MSPEQAFVVNHSQSIIQSSRNSMTRGCPVNAILLRKIKTIVEISDLSLFPKRSLRNRDGDTYVRMVWMVPVQRIEKGFDPRFSELVLPFVSDSACFRAALRFCLQHSSRPSLAHSLNTRFHERQHGSWKSQQQPQK